MGSDAVGEGLQREANRTAAEKMFAELIMLGFIQQMYYHV
jgi:hypothetical protein